MKIVCPSCSAAYRFEAAKVPDGGKKVQCSRCSHVFMVRRPDDPEAPTLPSESTGTHGHTAPVDAEPRRLIVRQDGTRYKVRDLPTLQRWIVERRLTREAEVSFDGERWERVGDRDDLLPYFEMVDREAQRSFLAPSHGADSTRISVKPRIEGVRVITTLRPRAEGEELEELDDFDEDDDDLYEDDDELGVFVDSDDDEDDEGDPDEVIVGDGLFVPTPDEDRGAGEVVSWQGAPAAPSPAEATPIFNKRALISEDADDEGLEVELEAEVPRPRPTPVTPPAQPEEAERSGAALWPLALVAILLIGLVYVLFLRTPGETTPVANLPPIGGTSNGGDGKPPVVVPVRTPTPKPVAVVVTPTPTAKPTPTATAKPTPTPTAKPTPKPVRRPPTQVVARPPDPAPSASPAVLADRAYKEAKSLQNKGDFAGAVEQFKLANRHRPRAIYYEELGFTYLELHDARKQASDLTQAESAFKEALKLDKRADAWLGLGVTFRRQSRNKDAIEAFEACLRASPSENTAGEAEWFLKELKAGK